MVKLKSSLRQFTVATMSVMEFLCHKLQRYVPFVIITIRSFPQSWLIASFVARVTRQVQHMEQDLLTRKEQLSSPRVFTGFRVARSFVFFVMFSRSLFVLLDFFIWSLCCLFFFDLPLMVAPLVFSNISYHGMDIWKHII